MANVYLPGDVLHQEPTSVHVKIDECGRNKRRELGPWSSMVSACPSRK